MSSAVVFLTLLVASPAAAQTEPLAERLQPCTLDPAGLDARCGTLDVPISDDPAAGTLELHLAVIPARSSEPAPDPVFVIAGGPGESAIATASVLGLDRLRGANARRDLVLVDQRGTGRSSPLRCDLSSRSPQQLASLVLFPRPAIESCVDSLHVDVAAYTTPRAVEDLERVRRALGYERINLDGASYGARAALAFLRRHPEVVRTVTISGISATHRAAFQAGTGATRRAFEGVLSRCAEDPACQEAFPDLTSRIEELLSELGRRPVTASLQTAPGIEVDVEVGARLLRGALQAMLTSAELSSQLPMLVAATEAGDASLLLAGARSLQGLVDRALASGMFLTVWCNEFSPFYDLDELRAEAGLLGTSVVLEETERPCSLWPGAELPASHFEPVRSDVPVLGMSGELDPVTPPAAAREVLRGLSRSRLVVFPGAGHQIGHVECQDRIVAEFLDSADPGAIDAGCARAAEPPPFVIPER